MPASPAKTAQIASAWSGAVLWAEGLQDADPEP